MFWHLEMTVKNAIISQQMAMQHVGKRSISNLLTLRSYCNQCKRLLVLMKSCTTDEGPVFAKRICASSVFNPSAILSLCLWEDTWWVQVIHSPISDGSKHWTVEVMERTLGDKQVQGHRSCLQKFSSRQWAVHIRLEHSCISYYQVDP